MRDQIDETHRGKRTQGIMRQGPHPKRSRGRGGSNGGGGGMSGPRKHHLPLRLQTFDSNGPDVRIRGNAYQVHEKYLQLARDAQSSGDRVAAENYFQHAEHYYRIIAADLANTQAQGGQPGQQPGGNFPSGGPQPTLQTNSLPSNGTRDPMSGPDPEEGADANGQPLVSPPPQEPVS